jgi:hypothetical protein
VERKYSDSLLITLLKARMPAKYKEHDVGAIIAASGDVALYLPQKQALVKGGNERDADSTNETTQNADASSEQA